MNLYILCSLLANCHLNINLVERVSYMRQVKFTLSGGLPIRYPTAVRFIIWNVILANARGYFYLIWNGYNEAQIKQEITIDGATMQYGFGSNRASLLT